MPGEKLLQSLDLVFDTALHRIEVHNKLFDSLDLKVSILISFLGALVVGLLAALLTIGDTQLTSILPPLATYTGVVAVVFAGLGITFSFFSYRAREYALGINVDDFVEWTNETLQNTKEAFLPTLIEAIRINDTTLAEKQFHARYAIWCTFLTLLFFLFTLIEVITTVASNSYV